MIRTSLSCVSFSPTCHWSTYSWFSWLTIWAWAWSATIQFLEERCHFIRLLWAWAIFCWWWWWCSSSWINLKVSEERFKVNLWEISSKDLFLVGSPFWKCGKEFLVVSFFLCMILNGSKEILKSYFDIWTKDWGHVGFPFFIVTHDCVVVIKNVAIWESLGYLFMAAATHHVFHVAHAHSLHSIEVYELYLHFLFYKLYII